MVDAPMIAAEERMILCCQCAVAIPPNAINMCANCLQTQFDIGAGIAKQCQQNTCRGCNRYERRDGSWAAAEIESKELLAILLKKPRGLASVRLADATFVWTEPHSKRLKVRVTIQKEVVQGAVLQQSFVIQFVVGNKQCPQCQRREAKDTWTALLQVRQKVPHKRTFLWLEQLILRHGAHAETVNIVECKDGIDFYFDQRSHAEKLLNFLQGVTAIRCGRGPFSARVASARCAAAPAPAPPTSPTPPSTRHPTPPRSRALPSSQIQVFDPAGLRGHAHGQGAQQVHLRR